MTKRARKPKRRAVAPPKPPSGPLYPQVVQRIATPLTRLPNPPTLLTGRGVFVGSEFICAERVIHPYGHATWQPCS